MIADPNAARTVRILRDVEYTDNTRTTYGVIEEDLLWLVQQAKVAREQSATAQAYERENARLRKALQEIAEETGTPCAEIANKALKGESE